jgi:hypothetical protein
MDSSSHLIHLSSLSPLIPFLSLPFPVSFFFPLIPIPSSLSHHLFHHPSSSPFSQILSPHPRPFPLHLSVTHHALSLSPRTSFVTPLPSPWSSKPSPLPVFPFPHPSLLIIPFPARYPHYGVDSGHPSYISSSCSSKPLSIFPFTHPSLVTTRTSIQEVIFILIK